MKTPELIIFDFDGTLADTTDSILSTYRLTIEELDMEKRSDNECRATIGIPLKGAFRQLYPAYTDSMLDTCVTTYRRIYSDNKSLLTPSLYPGVRETLMELAARGCMMSIASSRSYRSLADFCDYHQLSKFFSLVRGADSVLKAKPDPEPVLHTMEVLKKSADRTLMVGDMPVDIAMGRGAKCTTVGVTYGNSSHDELSNAGANYIIDNFTDLLNIVIHA